MSPIHPFFFFAGLVLGLVFSVTIVPGVVWVVQISLNRGFLKGIAAGLAIALAQGFWAAMAALIIFWAARFSWQYDFAFRLLSALLLSLMGWSVFRSPKITSLKYDGSLWRIGQVFRHTVVLAMTMPMRLQGYLALLIAVNLHLRPRPPANAILFGCGIVLGSLAWWTFYAVLASLFGHRVSEEITLKSMNKLRVLALMVILGLLLIGLTPMVPGFR